MKKSFVTKKEAYMLSYALFSVFTFPIIVVFYANLEHFALTSFCVVSVVAAVYTVSALIFGTLLWKFRRSRFSAVIGYLAPGIAVSVIIEYYFSGRFFPDYIGEALDIEDRILLFGAHMFVVTIPLISAYKFRRTLLKYSAKVSLVIFLSQSVCLAANVFRFQGTQTDYDFQEYSFTEKDKFTFSRKDNIILLVIDSMGRDIALEMLAKYPEVKDMLHGFVGYDNMKSPVPWTMYAVPSMLSGIEFPHEADGNPSVETEHSEFLKYTCRDKNGVFQGLKQRGYRVEGYPFLLQTISYAPDVIDNSIPVTRDIQLTFLAKLFKETAKAMTVLPLRYVIFNENDMDFVNPGSEAVFSEEQYDVLFYKTLAEKFNANSNEKIFKYLHLHGAHDVVTLNENLEPDDSPQRVKQLRGSFKVVDLLLKKMKSAGIFDNSIIIVTGDHSEVYSPETICFVKMRGSTGNLSFNSNECRVRDIAGTIMKEFDSDLVLSSLPTGSKKEQAIPTSKEMYAEFSEWKPVEFAKKPIANEMLPTSMRIENDKLIFERFPDGRGVLSSYQMLVKSEFDGKCYQADVVPVKGERYMVSRKINFPDGCYRIEVYSSYAGRHESWDRSRRLHNGFLVVERGKKRLVKENPYPAKNVVSVGDYLDFEFLRKYPMLEFPENHQVNPEQLVMPNGSDLCIKLAPSEEKSMLEIVVPNKPCDPCFLNVSADNGFFCRVMIKDISGTKVAIPLGKLMTETKLRINFKIDVPQRVPKAQVLKIKIRLQSISRQKNSQH